jgi:integrase
MQAPITTHASTKPDQPSRSTSPRFPIVYRQRGCTVRIYKTPNNGSAQFTLAYYLGTKRKRQKFTDLAQAQEEAQHALTKLVNGESEALRLTGMDRSVYVHANQTLADQLPGRNLLQVVEEHSAARKLLPADVCLLDVCRDWLSRNAFPAQTPREVLTELVKAKRDLGMSTAYLYDFKRLAKFCESYDQPLLSITTSDVEQFLNGLEAAPQTRNNCRKLLRTLFQFATHRGYAPKNHDVMDGVAKARMPDTEIEIFTPAEIQRLLTAVRPELVPYLAIGAFAGLRTAELKRLDWSEVNLTERFIEVTAKKAKTGSRRLVPITDNLHAWLLPFASPAGQVVLFAENLGRQRDRFVADVNQMYPDAGFEWKRNGLRHSFVSYRLASEKDTAQVALEAGNSPQVIFKHYRQLVTEAEAGRWFSIHPPSPA